MNIRVLFPVVMVLFFLSRALADGVGIYIHPNVMLQLEDESKQVALISWKDGMEQMLLRVSFPNRLYPIYYPIEGGRVDINTSKRVWIFPVPADPDEVAVHHIRSVSFYDSGKNLYKSVKENTKGAMATTFVASQIWPIFPSLLMLVTGSTGKSVAIPLAAEKNR